MRFRKQTKQSTVIIQAGEENTWVELTGQLPERDTIGLIHHGVNNDAISGVPSECTIEVLVHDKLGFNPTTDFLSTGMIMTQSGLFAISMSVDYNQGVWIRSGTIGATVHFMEHTEKAN